MRDSKPGHPTFRKLFPNAERLRHAVAHTAELTQTRTNLQKNAADGHFAYEQVIGQTLRVTFKGKFIEFEISAATLEKLHDVWALIAPALRQAIDVSETEYQKRFPEEYTMRQRLSQNA